MLSTRSTIQSYRLCGGKIILSCLTHLLAPHTEQESLSGLFIEVEASSTRGFRLQDSIKETDQETMLRVYQVSL